MRDPFTKLPLLLHGSDSFVQSWNLCFPLRFVIAKDNTKTLDGFRVLYDAFSTGAVSRGMQCKQFNISFPGDMKLQWGALAAGGAAKVKEHFCYICSYCSSTLHLPQDESTTCTIFAHKIERKLEVEHCYHNPFLADPDVRIKLEDELCILNLLVQDVLLEDEEEPNIADATIDRNNDDDNRSNGTDGQDQQNRPQKQTPKMCVRKPGNVISELDKMDIDFVLRSKKDKALCRDRSHTNWGVVPWLVLDLCYIAKSDCDNA